MRHNQQNTLQVDASEQLPAKSLSQTSSSATQLTAIFTRDPLLIEQAQRLRHRVFSEEYGAQFDHPELDKDQFDTICDHLLVCDQQNKIIAYTRLINDQQAIEIGHFYSENEFDLQEVKALPGKKMELGRTCIHPDYRTGAGLTTLWSALTSYLVEHDYQWLFGCCSIPLDDNCHALHSTLNTLQKSTIGQSETANNYSVSPATPLPFHIERQLSQLINAEDCSNLSNKKNKTPPLLKSYLRMGAKAIGAPCWDSDFNCADIFILMNINDMPAKYLNHFARHVLLK
ncbi:GNAT family N-acetyltransferase [Pelagibaculum spongiae]|uniref:L-ornithine N(alpha)-acyltransferase n=1 Tax=Pelagibaculum spongiae TaxID=2080658 RepID=A0A2V1GPY7_9GAMM|nr:GNAT family N-acyltransferase [Pelagibaculum spongiae]PVZ62955.1 hemolysin [Pelagibaculum spongiae]